MRSYSSDDYTGTVIKGAVLDNPTIINSNNPQDTVPTSTDLTNEITAAKARANHTGTQLAATISDLPQAVDSRITLQKGAAGGLATLGTDAKLNPAQMPDAATITQPTIVSPIIDTPNINGILNSNGPIRANDSLLVSNILADKAWTFIFNGTTANQKFDVYCSSTNGLESLMDITVSTGIGTLVKRFSLVKQGTGILQSGSRYTEVIGNIGPYLAISDIEWDTANSRWRFKIVNRSPAGTAFNGSVSIRLIANNTNALNLINTFGVGSIYTNDITTYAEPIYSFSGAIQADALITNFIKKGVNYTVTPVDSIIICTAGIIVTLPQASIVGIGRSYTIKNIQNSGVTVKPQGTSKIDNTTQFTVGNGKTITVTCDGLDWWITSAY